MENRDNEEDKESPSFLIDWTLLIITALLAGMILKAFIYDY